MANNTLFAYLHQRKVLLARELEAATAVPYHKSSKDNCGDNKRYDRLVEKPLRDSATSRSYLKNTSNQQKVHCYTSADQPREFAKHRSPRKAHEVRNEALTPNRLRRFPLKQPDSGVSPANQANGGPRMTNPDEYSRKLRRQPRQLVSRTDKSCNMPVEDSQASLNDEPPKLLTKTKPTARTASFYGTLIRIEPIDDSSSEEEEESSTKQLDSLKASEVNSFGKSGLSRLVITKSRQSAEPIKPTPYPKHSNGQLQNTPISLSPNSAKLCRANSALRKAGSCSSIASACRIETYDPAIVDNYYSEDRGYKSVKTVSLTKDSNEEIQTICSILLDPTTGCSSRTTKQLSPTNSSSTMTGSPTPNSQSSSFSRPNTATSSQRSSPPSSVSGSMKDGNSTKSSLVASVGMLHYRSCPDLLKPCLRHSKNTDTQLTQSRNTVANHRRTQNSQLLRPLEKEAYIPEPAVTLPEYIRPGGLGNWATKPLETWSLDDILEWLQYLSFDDVASILIGYDVTGAEIAEWDAETLESIGIVGVPRRIILHELEQLKNRNAFRAAYVTDAEATTSNTHDYGKNWSGNIFELLNENSQQTFANAKTPNTLYIALPIKCTASDVQQGLRNFEFRRADGYFQVMLKSSVPFHGFPLQHNDCLIEVNGQCCCTFPGPQALMDHIAAMEGEISFVVLRQIMLTVSETGVCGGHTSMAQTTLDDEDAIYHEDTRF